MSDETPKEISGRKRRSVAPKKTGADDLAIDRKIQEILPKGAPPEVVRQITTISEQHSGPLPSPNDFEKYEQTLPGMADRIMTLAEKEQDMRDRNIDGALNSIGRALDNDREQIRLSAFCTLALIAAAFASGYFGQPVVAVFLGVSGVIVGVINAVGKIIRGPADD